MFFTLNGSYKNCSIKVCLWNLNNFVIKSFIFKCAQVHMGSSMNHDLNSWTVHRHAHGILKVLFLLFWSIVSVPIHVHYMETNSMDILLNISFPFHSIKKVEWQNLLTTCWTLQLKCDDSTSIRGMWTFWSENSSTAGQKKNTNLKISQQMSHWERHTEGGPFWTCA